jgi:thioredoxin-like negative regulator of GroEL
MLLSLAPDGGTLTSMPATPPSPEWIPGAAPVSAEDFDACPVLVVHYWAQWDVHDRLMDGVLAELRNEYAGRVCFRSCDVDRPENQSFLHGLASVPALGCFICGRLFDRLIGLRRAAELRATLDGWAAPTPRPASTARTTSWLGKLFGRSLRS